MSADLVENRIIRVDECVPHPQNYNQHDAEQVEDLRLSLQKFGQVRSVVVQDDAAGGFLMVAGHGIMEAAKQEGISTLRADVIPADWPPVKVLAYLAADNELSKSASPDDEQLALLVQSVRDVDKDLAILAAGGEMALLDLMTLVTEPATVDLNDSDLLHEIDDRWGVNEGDVWVADDGFCVVCGDCTDPAVWQSLLNYADVQQVQLVVTSPPYAQQRSAKYGGVRTDEYVDWWADVQSCVRDNIAEDGSFFINIKPHVENGERSLYVMDLVLSMARKWGWCYIDEFVWVHQGYPGALIGRFKNQFEPVFQFSLLDGEVTELTAEESFSVHHFGVVDGRNLKFDPEPVLHELSDDHYEKIQNRQAGSNIFQQDYESESTMGNFKYYKRIKGARPGNVLSVNVGAVHGDYPHAAVFPIELPEFFIRAYSDPGDVICDPFCGSGTTLVAAQRHGRVGVGIEKMPKYMAVILQRLSDMDMNPVRAVVGSVNSD